MHADAAMGARVVLDPTGVESVIGFEFTPVWHWGTFKQPTSWFFAQHGLSHIAAVVRITMSVGAFFFILVEDTEAA